MTAHEIDGEAWRPGPPKTPGRWWVDVGDRKPAAFVWMYYRSDGITVYREIGADGYCYGEQFGADITNRCRHAPAEPPR